MDRAYRAATKRLQRCIDLGCDSVTTHPKCPYTKFGDDKKADDESVIARAHLRTLTNEHTTSNPEKTLVR